MAGGRRPASYVSGARHNTGVDRSNTIESPTNPQISSIIGPSLPPWIPSIWQPTSSKTPPPREPCMMPVPRLERSLSAADPSSALAAALDSAVHSAVVRALGSTGSTTTPPSPHMHSAIVETENTVAEPRVSEPSWLAREVELTSTIDALQTRLDKKDKDIQNLSDRLLSLERKVNVDVNVANHREKRITVDMATHTKNVEHALAKSDEYIDSRLLNLQDLAKANQSNIAKVRSSQKNCEAETTSVKKWAHDLSAEMAELEANVSTELERSWSQVDQMGQSFKAQLSMVQASFKEQSVTESEKEISALKRSVEASAECFATLRSKLKRVESQMAEVAKQCNDMVALNNGFEETMRDSLGKVTSVITDLRTAVSQLQKDVSSEARTGGHADFRARVDNLESNLKALKKLIESNLRTQWNAESIVKEQVSLITKHVCVAMRQYTARRISENNSLIDQALRARLPEYAKNEDQFVLVREQDSEGNESVDIQRSAEVSSNSSS